MLILQNSVYWIIQFVLGFTTYPPEILMGAFVYFVPLNVIYFWFLPFLLLWWLTQINLIWCFTLYIYLVGILSYLVFVNPISLLLFWTWNSLICQITAGCFHRGAYTTWNNQTWWGGAPPLLYNRLWAYTRTYFTICNLHTENFTAEAISHKKSWECHAKIPAVLGAFWGKWEEEAGNFHSTCFLPEVIRSTTRDRVPATA